MEPTARDRERALEIIGEHDAPRHDESVEWCTACRCLFEGMDGRVSQALADQRERAAKIAERWMVTGNLNAGVDTGEIWRNATARDIAADIRAGDQETP